LLYETDVRRGPVKALGSKSRATRVSAILVLALLGWALTSRAQESVRRGIVLHEYFEGGALQPRGDAQGALAPGEGRGMTPTLSLEPRPGEMIFSGDGPIGDVPIDAPHGPLDPRAGESRLDGETDRVDQLDYFENFDPSIIPYKRLIAQNRVRREPSGGYAMVLESRRQRPVLVEPREVRSDEDPFWGTFLLRVSPGELFAIPSVAADQSLLSLDAEPAVPIDVFRDDADNYYVRAAYDGLIRVNMRLAAPRYYFDGVLSDAVRWADFPQELLPGLEPKTAEVADSVLTELGVSRRESPRQALHGLVEHFRDFEGRPLAEAAARGDLYRTIALEKTGVCRHRSLAFVVTAQALGIPARYVSNEAHAFVEVYWPGQGWRRIDLGGAAEEVRRRDGGQGRVHDGAAADPFPQPPAYLSELERIMGRDERGTGANDAVEREPTGELGQGSGEEALPDREPMNLPARSDGDSGRAGLPGSAIDLDPLVESLEDGRLETQVRILSAQREVMRGEPMTIRGDLRTADGTWLTEREVKVFLVPAGAAAPTMERQIGQGRTDGQGRFEVIVTLDGSISIGRWALRAMFEGDEELRASTSR
jgi:hypothetical protein